MTGMSRLSLGLTAALIVVAPAFADGQRGFLETIRHHSTLTSTVPDNGYLNPCAIVAAARRQRLLLRRGRRKHSDGGTVTHNGDIPSRPSRRGFLAGAAGGLAAAGAGFAARAATPSPFVDMPTAPTETEPFWGPHQGGILTAPQSHSYFAAFDLHAKKREDVTDLLRRWT